ncbi:hypothetical protein EYS14_22985 [Alteromonadaceae bacterium M269]|nr:hypothetical protein EYS14_22985 [Alteromonadaceae bacterium M269]
MKSTIARMNYGFWIWFLPFLIGMLLFPIMSTESALFDTLMAISLTAAASWGSYRYLRRNPSERLNVKRLLLVGLFWFVLAILFDAPIFLFSDFGGMSASEYMTDIGLSYLMIPIIVVTVGLAMNHSPE